MCLVTYALILIDFGLSALKPKVAGRCGGCLLWMTTAILSASSPEAMSSRQLWKRVGQQQAPTERDCSRHNHSHGSNSRSASRLREHMQLGLSDA